MNEQPTDFAALGLSSAALALLSEHGYSEPTPIQVRAIPPLLAGDDVIGQAATGSGKTLAFALPLLERIEPDRQVQGLVLCPTRDLCQQVAREIRRLARYRANLRVVILSGGTPIAPQTQTLARGAHVLVATPGRLLDHLRRGNVDLATVTSVVLDEADRMLDLGLAEEVEAILERTPHQRQTALFSATFPQALLRLSGQYQKNPVRIELTAAQPKIEQWRYQVEPVQRFDALLAALANRPQAQAMVFCNTKQAVDEISNGLQRAGFAADRLHGGMDQPFRDSVLARFRNASIHVLVASDVAARGLDISGLGLVVNYELPKQAETYVHRIGRTGRAGETGLAVSIHTPDEAFRLEAIEAAAGVALERRPLSRDNGAPPPLAAMTTLWIAGGRKDKIRPGDILGALTGEAGLAGEQVGRIEIGEKVSYVALAPEAVATALKRLRDGKIKGRRFRVGRAD